MEKLIDERESITATKDDKKFVKIVEDDNNEYNSEAICPIISEGDIIGAVVIFNKDANSKMGEVEQKLAQSAAGFLGRQMEQS